MLKSLDMTFLTCLLDKMVMITGLPQNHRVTDMKAEIMVDNRLCSSVDMQSELGRPPLNILNIFSLYRSHISCSKISPLPLQGMGLIKGGHLVGIVFHSVQTYRPIETFQAQSTHFESQRTCFSVADRWLRRRIHHEVCTSTQPSRDMTAHGASRPSMVKCLFNLEKVRLQVYFCLPPLTGQ